MYYHTGMKESKQKPNVSIRIDPEVLHQARVAAVSSKKTLGKWLEEAIKEKIERSGENGHTQNKS
jgi:predicted HicB family RNase H-like nuclease